MSKKHAKYSPSSIYRVLACAGSVKLSEGIPSRTSPAAEEGTLAHELMELMLLGKRPLVSKYPDYMRTDVRHFVADLNKYQTPTSELLVETKVDLTFIHEELYGTADVSIVDLYDRLHVIDFKYGKGYVSEKNNPQLMTYLLGIAHLYSYDFADYEVSIYQPRYKGKSMRTYVTTKKELKEFAKLLMWGIDEAESKNPSLNVGNHCHFCPAKDICPERDGVHKANAKLDFDNE
jgi:hypothetical protein